MTEMTLHLTSAQLRRLDEFNAIHDDDWAIRRVEDGRLEVTVHPFAMYSFERFITPDGDVQLYDEDHDVIRDAPVTALTSSYFQEGKEVRFNY